MRNRYITILSLAVMAFILLVGCSQRAEPEEIYQDYYKACKNGNFNDAKLLLDENAFETSRKLGACAFTHDAINTVEVQKGYPVRTFTQEPTVTTHEKKSSITWLDDQGSIATVTLLLVDGQWKISNTTWSY